MAPEMFARASYGRPVDMWALGVILYIILAGLFPYDPDERKFDCPFPSPEFDNISAHAKDLLLKLLEINADKRYTVDQALAHPWLAAAPATAVSADNLRSLVATNKLEEATVAAVLASNVRDTVATNIFEQIDAKENRPAQEIDVTALPQLLSCLKEKTMYFKQLNRLLVKRLRYTADIVSKRPLELQAGPLQADMVRVTQSVLALQLNWNTPHYCKTILAARMDNLTADFDSANTKLLDICRQATGNFSFTFEEEEVPAARKKDVSSFNAANMVDILLPDLQDGIIFSKAKDSVEERLAHFAGKPFATTASKLCAPLYCFQDLKLLGSGGFADVFYGRYDNKEVAVKILRNMICTEDVGKEFDKETQVLTTIDSPYVVKFVGANTSPACLCILMEYVEGGTLEKFLAQNSDAPLTLKLRMAKEVALGLGALHTRKMLHCDLKPANVLLDKDLHCKLTDFGLTVIKDENTSKMTVSTPSAFGTLHYMAPELFLEERPRYSTYTDVYAFGVLLWGLATQRRPYAGIMSFALVGKVTTGYREGIPANVPTPLRELIMQCWNGDKSVRPSIQTIVEQLDNLMAQM